MNEPKDNELPEVEPQDGDAEEMDFEEFIVHALSEWNEGGVPVDVGDDVVDILKSIDTSLKTLVGLMQKK